MAVNKTKRKKVHKKYGCKCAYCGVKIAYDEMHVDHIVPKYNFEKLYQQYAYNGLNNGIPVFLLHLTEKDIDHIDNLNPACRVCNKAKDTFSLEKFRQEIMMKPSREKRNRANYRLALKYGLIKEMPLDVVFYFEKHQHKADRHINTITDEEAGILVKRTSTLTAIGVDRYDWGVMVRCAPDACLLIAEDKIHYILSDTRKDLDEQAYQTAKHYLNQININL